MGGVKLAMQIGKQAWLSHEFSAHLYSRSKRTLRGGGGMKFRNIQGKDGTTPVMERH